MPKTNYEIMQERMEKRFLEYDQAEIAEKLSLTFDDDYIYIELVKNKFRVNRKTGVTENADPPCDKAGFNEAMTIYDVLCDSKSGAKLAGEFVAHGTLAGHLKPPDEGKSFYKKFVKYFDGRAEMLRAACEALDGIQMKNIADVSYRLELFSFLPVWLRFWESDDEFDAKLQIMWDRNATDFIRYETTFFAQIYLLNRIKSIMEKFERD